MRHSNSKAFYLNEHRELKSKMIIAPKTIIHCEHLAHRAAPLARTRSALQISLQSSAPSSSSYEENANLQESEKLTANKCSTMQKSIPKFKKNMMHSNEMSHSVTTTTDSNNSGNGSCSNTLDPRNHNYLHLAPTGQTNRLLLQHYSNTATSSSSCYRPEENMRNDCENEQFKYYSNQNKSSDMTDTFSCPEKFFKRHVVRQASFLAAVSRGNSHRCKEIRSISIHDLRSNMKISNESLLWQDTGSTTHLTPYYTNTIRSNESSSAAMSGFSTYASSDNNEIKSYSNIPQHSTYYVSDCN
ncbi:hypothetical protein LOAG_04638 [Loa loa]|uniref:Uncharacterized protein n=1 Tax=Loa loa TaxID=7209 RepID=A0A1S0U1R5_LOALO|nr:hypothetical protein LOAG_04638 [Loa loa]EFO23851.2 hypothetical protein LOAG_04638 [Loa loa]